MAYSICQREEQINDGQAGRYGQHSRRLRQGDSLAYLFACLVIRKILGKNFYFC
jgi:hypothetical protein